MMTRNLSVATIALGVLGASIGACSAQSSGTPPRPNDGAGNTANGGATTTGNPSSGGSSPTNTGTGNTGNTGNTGDTASGGTSSNTGPGAPGGTLPGSTGGGGASAGAGGSGPVTGASGATTASAGCPLVLATPDQLIDDLEDGNNQIATVGSRIGYWYTYNDMTGGTQIPATSATMPFKPMMLPGGGHCGSAYWAHTSGNALFTSFGAGMGFDFNNVAGASTVYNASAYTGISFWAKGTPGIRAMIKIPATTVSTSPGGTCVAPATVTPACLCECENHFAINPMLTGDWAQYMLPFAAIKQDPTWGKQVTFDKTKILAVQFQVVKMVAFDFSVDDVTFY
jgi:hypothetical protein